MFTCNVADIRERTSKESKTYRRDSAVSFPSFSLASLFGNFITSVNARLMKSLFFYFPLRGCFMLHKKLS